METDITEMPDPLFLQNEKGMISLYLPAFVGEPDETALLRFVADDRLEFVRSKTANVFLTDIPQETMQELAKVKKILLVEVDADKSLQQIENALEAVSKGDDLNLTEEEEMALFRRIYEIPVIF